MKNYLRIQIIVGGLLLFLGCSELEGHKALGSDAVAPGKVEVVQIKNKPGGAVIYYKTPNDTDLLYVKATYKDDKGKYREVKMSKVLDSIVIVGFGKTGDYNVAISAFDTGDNQSVLTDAIISPEPSAVEVIFPTLTGEVDYGGIKVSYINILKASFSLNISQYNPEQDKWVFRESFFTSQKSGTYTFRGYKSVKTKFRIYVEDLYGNVSDFKEFEVTPVPDETLNKKLFSVFRLPGDKDFGQYGFSETQMWNDQYNTQWDCGHTDFQTKLPHYLTLDLGTKAKLSRFKLYQRAGGELYKHGNPKHFKIYGMLDNPNLPNQTWILLKECFSFKPSGLPIGQNTAEDFAYQEKGENFEFDFNNLVEIRYIRIEVLENWGGIDGTVIGELSFYGEILK